MDMLFDPYADGPFQAASKSATGTKSPAGSGLDGQDSGAGFGPGGNGGGFGLGSNSAEGHGAGGGIWPAGGPGPHGAGGIGGHATDGGWDRPQLPNASELLEGLNPQQEEAVKHAGSALLIVAGAGSGKTRVLSNRIAYLIATRRAHHGEILAITFTNKAAAEMRERIEALVGGRAKTMWISTFHSSCVRILRREAKNVGLNSNFSIYDSADSLRLITLVAKNLDLDPKRFPPKAIQHKISALKNELIDDDSYASSANYNDPFEQAVAEVFKGYTQRLRQANAMDFDDLIAETVYMFRAFPALAESYRRRFRHVLVDEYQDTNHAQYALVREIVGEGPDAAELTVVGDSDQSIYAFRGADIRNILEFEKDYPDARTIKLEQNYRSTQTILNAANSVISRNPNRPEKRLWTAEGDGEKIVGYVGENEHDEAQFIAKEIDRLQDEGNLRPATSRSSTAPTPSPARLKTCWSAWDCRTRWSAAPASTSARRSRTRSRTCGSWSTRTTTSTFAGSSTSPSAESATAPRVLSLPLPSVNAPPSWPPPGAPTKPPAWPPARSTRCWAS